MPRDSLVPDPLSGNALKDLNQQTREVEKEVAPYEKLDAEECLASLRRGEDSEVEEEDRELGDEDQGRVHDLRRVCHLTYQRLDWLGKQLTFA